MEELFEAFEEGGPAPIFGGKDFSFFEEATSFVEASVPEPSSMLLASLAALGFVLNKRKR